MAKKSRKVSIAKSTKHGAIHLDIEQEWLLFVATLAEHKPAFTNGNQDIHRDVQWSIAADTLLKDASITLENTCYKDAKIKQLLRHYRNPQTILSAVNDLRWRVDNKKYGSGAFDFRGEEKKTTKQSFCLQNGAVAYYPGRDAHSQLFVTYRTAEAISRFRGDLIFLRDEIFPTFQFVFDVAPPKEIVFHFYNITIHPMFYFMWCERIREFENHLQYLKIVNPRLYRNVLKLTLHHVRKEHRAYATYRRLQDGVHSLADKRWLKKLEKYCDENLSELS